MKSALQAGAAYFAGVFFVAFALGAVRALFLVPRFGEVAAVSFEAPIVLTVSWYVSRWTAGKFGVADVTAPRAAMGAFAFVLLMAAELALSTLVFRTPLESYVAAFGSAPGAIGLAAQIAFAFVPLMQRKHR